MKQIILLISALFILGSLTGQEIKTVATGLDKAKEEAPPDTAKHHWKFGGFGSLTINQAAYSNWAAGGTNSLGATGMLNLRLRYTKNKHSWANLLDAAYGFQLLGKTIFVLFWTFKLLFWTFKLLFRVFQLLAKTI